jgi:multiple sugar transport system substrate-binding protein
MSTSTATSRRAFLKGIAATAATATIGAVLAACGGSSATDTPKAASGSATTAPASGTSAPATTGSAVANAPAKAFSGKLTAWGIVSFTKDGDNLLGQQMQDWGKANNVSVEYVALPGSDYTTKVAAAVETGAIPDVVMMSGTSTIFYAAQNRLVDLTDIYNNLKGLGGGMFEQLLPYVQTNGKIYSIPMESDVSVMYARLDLCEKATGKREPPATMDELDMIARKVNAPPTQYGIGLTLGRTPDGAGNMTTMIFGDGGTLVDKDGKPAINNDGTITALTRIQTWWKDKIIPQDSPSWDDSGNNNSYQSKQSAFVINPASIFAYLDKNDKELLGNTIQAPTPKGKAGISYNGVGTWSWSVFSASKQVEAGKAMIQAIMQPDKMEAVYELVGGRWYPVYKDLANAPFWKQRPYFDLFPQIIQSTKPAWAPATATPDLLTQMSAVDQKLIYAEMVQDVVVSNKSPQDAAKAAQTKMEQAFAEAIKK